MSENLQLNENRFAEAELPWPTAFFYSADLSSTSPSFSGKPSLPSLGRSLCSLHNSSGIFNATFCHRTFAHAVPFA